MKPVDTGAGAGPAGASPPGDEGLLDLPGDLLDALPAAVYVCDSDGLIRRFNRKAVELWGRTPKLNDPEHQFCGSLRLYQLDGGPLPHDRCPMVDVLRTGEAVRDREVVIERPDGSRITALVNIAALRNAAGAITGAVNCFHDITERKCAEAELRRSQQDLEDHFENGVVGLHWVGPDGTVLRANKAELDMLGYSREEYVGRNIAEIHADRVTIDSILAQLSRGKRLDRHPARLRRKDGSIRDVLISSNVRFEGGRFVNTRCFTLDVTETRRAEAALRESESRNRALVEAFAAVVWTAEPDGRVVDIPQWRALTGQTVEEVRGWGWIDAIHPDDRAATRDTWARAVGLRCQSDAEYRVRIADGTYRWFNGRGVPILAEDGTTREWVGVCIDIMQRKEAEQHNTLLAREIDHRAKNMLTVVQAITRMTRADTVHGYVEALTGRLGALARAQSLLAETRWAGASLARLIEEELAAYADSDASRLSLSGPELALAPDAAQALAMIFHELATNAAKHGALSVPGGRVAVEWSWAANGRLALGWTESGGPPVGAPSRRSFGTVLIETTVEGQLGGTVRLDWPVEGLACRMTFPRRCSKGALLQDEAPVAS